jgi:AAA domain
MDYLLPEDAYLAQGEALADIPVDTRVLTPAANGNGHHPDDQPPEPDGDLFKRWTTGQLLDAPRTFAWLIRGCWTDPTYGQIAGEMKTLKSHVSTFMQVAVASGQPLFGRFHVDTARPVIVYVGEGGRIAYTERLERTAQAMGVHLREIPLYATFDVAPLASDVFKESLRRDLADLQPALVVIDPLYAYHGTTTKASDLHAEGSLLSSVSAPCLDAGASLNIVNHFNQTGEGQGLQRITMAGSGEWVDSWILLRHRQPADVNHGRFYLRIEIGSRRWGGTTWDLDLNLGRFDPDLGRHDGDITWALHTATNGGAGDSDDVDPKVAECMGIISRLLSRGSAKTGKAIRGLIKGYSTDTKAAALEKLVEDGHVLCQPHGQARFYSNLRPYPENQEEDTQDDETF